MFFRALPLLFLLSLPYPALADSYGCEPMAPPVLALLPLVGPVSYDLTRSMAGIRAMSEMPNIASTAVREMPVGLTSARLRTASSYEVTTQSKSNDPLICAQITHFNLEVGFEDVTIYMAREIPANSCAEAVVRDHEWRHVQTDRSVLQNFLPRAQLYIQDVLREIGMVRASTNAVAEAHIEARVNEAISTITQTLATEREAAQRQIDTTEEYARLSAECGGELQKILRQTR